MKLIRLFLKKPISQYHPALYFIIIWIRRGFRYVQWKTDGRQYAQSFHSNPLTFRVKKHQSVLIRKLGDSEQRWQKNKVINLKIASERISTILIKPNETFSFCQLVGLPTIKQGYVEGMELSFGQARGGIGGGICQIANLIHWLVLHSPLEVIQRSQHSFDPFPDQGRVLPCILVCIVISYHYMKIVELVFYLKLLSLSERVSLQFSPNYSFQL